MIGTLDGRLRRVIGNKSVRRFIALTFPAIPVTTDKELPHGERPCWGCRVRGRSRACVASHALEPVRCRDRPISCRMHHPVGWRRHGAACRRARRCRAGSRRPGSRRVDPATDGARQCRISGAVDEERRGNGARRVQGEQCPASRQRRWWLVAGRPKCRPAGDLRRGGDHRGPALRPIGERSRAGCAFAQHTGHRLLHGCERRCARCLSPELPAGDRCPPDHLDLRSRVANVRLPR